MKIKFGKMLLCGEPECPKNFSATLRKRVQSDDIIHAAKANVSDRGNETYLISFGMEKAHKNPHSAECALFETMQNISAESPAALEINFNYPQGNKCVTFENAVLSKCSASVDGRITTHFLEFTSGQKETK